MVLLSCVSVLLLVFKVDGYRGSGFKEESIEVFEKICDEVVENPNFKNELMIGKPWRVYYTWNVESDKKCRDMWFKKVNPLMVNQVRMRMQRYLQIEPNWDNASLFLTMSRYRRVLLVLDESKVPGSFMQVPFMPAAAFYKTPNQMAIPLFSMVMKLVHDNQYLIMSDCSAGVTFLLAQRNKTPNWSEITAIAQNYTKFGEGGLSCTRT